MAANDNTIPELWADGNLPPRVHIYQGKRKKTYYYITQNNKRVNLGHDREVAIELHAQAIGQFPAENKRFKLKSITEIWKISKKNARSRNIEFMLTLDDVMSMLERSMEKCEVTGIKFNESKPKGMRIRPWMASIDRKDSSLGYHMSNCRLVCAGVNISMNQFGDEFFNNILESMLSTKLDSIVESILHRKLSEMGLMKQES